MKKAPVWIFSLFMIVCLVGLVRCEHPPKYQLSGEAVLPHRDNAQPMELSTEAVQYITDLLNEAEWKDDVANCSNEYRFTTTRGQILYHDVCGTLRDPESKQSTLLTVKEQAEVNKLLGIEDKPSDLPDKQYRVTIVDDRYITNKIDTHYAPGEKVILTLTCPTEHYLNAYINEVGAPVTYDEDYYECLIFTMPCEDVQIDVVCKGAPLTRSFLPCH